MKKVAVVSVVLILTLLAIGCGSTPAASAGNPNMPSWLNDFPPEDVIWGIGTAKASTDSLSMQAAENRGRVAIANQIQSNVAAMFTDYEREAGGAENPAYIGLKESVSRNVTSIQLSGARPVKREKTPDGTWWYLVEYKKADAQAAVSQIVDTEAARYAEFKANDALRMLDAQIAKNEKPQVQNAD
ncbi:MAG: LPP20 family lipoprotein [Treponema sp.]|jgi:hypothetical protein|nr:LPP20 family lipoprotein [Treponema sp.]